MAGILVLFGLAGILLVIITAGGRWVRARERRGISAATAADAGYPGGGGDGGSCVDAGNGSACGDGGGGDGGGGGD